MIDIVFYSVIELLTAFAPNFGTFLLLRALFGIGMGGEWGLGASLAMESLPTHTRGLFSGILQQGYAFGYLLAALVYWIVFPHFGWRGLFVVGALPALLVIYIRAHVPESPVWERNRASGRIRRVDLRRFLQEHGSLLIYAALLMTAFNYMSHGTQDLYATYLQKQRGFNSGQTSRIAIIYAVGMICGGTVVGYLSQRLGAASRHHLICNLWNVSYSALDFRPEHRVVGCGRILDSIHGARRLGGGAGTLKRTFAAGFSRNFSGTGLSIGELCRRLRRAAAGLAGNEFLRDE